MRWEELVNPLPHTANLQQMTLKMSSQKYRKPLLIVGIITKKSSKHCGKSRNYLFWAIFSFATMFSKVVCFRGIRKRLQVGIASSQWEIKVWKVFLQTFILICMYFYACIVSTTRGATIGTNRTFSVRFCPRPKWLQTWARKCENPHVIIHVA